MATIKNHVQLSFIDGDDTLIVYPEMKSEDVVLDTVDGNETLEYRLNQLGYLAFHNKLARRNVDTILSTNVVNPPEGAISDATVLAAQYDKINLFDRNSLVIPPEIGESEIDDSMTSEETTFSSSRIAVLLNSPYLMDDSKISDYATWTSKTIQDYIDKYPRGIDVTIQTDKWVKAGETWVYDISFDLLPLTTNCRLDVSTSYNLEMVQRIREMIYDFDIENIRQEENHIIMTSFSPTKPDTDFIIRISFLGNSK